MKLAPFLLSALLALPVAVARADAVDQLRDFARDVKSGQASFTQTVTSADGKRNKVSQGSFEFQRPNRFRFAYAKPFEQLIVADGAKVWIYDADLNQASSRAMSKALGATPAALLAGGALEAEFALTAEPAREGLEWVRATPKAKDASFREMRVGFRGGVLAAVEVVDSFGQRSLLQFGNFNANAPVPAERFRFVPPAGAEVVEQ
jgi:outer membrane lipoprotein carrier protein